MVFKGELRGIFSNYLNNIYLSLVPMHRIRSVYEINLQDYNAGFFLQMGDSYIRRIVTLRNE